MRSMNDTPSPTKFYALLLKLRPLAPGTLMPFSGELVHGAWLNWLRTLAPEVAQQLHDGNKRRYFTCSSLQFPYTQERMLQAQRENTHLALGTQTSYTIRITLLLSELYPLLYDTLMDINMRTASSKQQPFMTIGKQAFALEEVISHPDDPSGWTGFTTCEKLVEQAKMRRFTAPAPLELEFASLTTCNWIHSANKIYGNHYARLPLPHYIFPSLARRWQELVSPELALVVQKERIEAYIAADGIVIDDYQLQTHSAHFVEHPQRGFVGRCRYLLRGPDDIPTAEEPLTVRQQIVLLAWMAFYTGVGYKTTMGMGQTRLR